MVKLKFKKWSNVGDVLTSDELKHVCGGMSSASTTYCSFCVIGLANNSELVISSESLSNQNNYNQGCISYCLEYNKTASSNSKCVSAKIEFYPCN